MTTLEAAKIADCHRSTIIRLCGSGKIKCHEGLSTRNKKTYIIDDSPERVSAVVNKTAPKSGFHKTAKTKAAPAKRALWTPEQVAASAGVSKAAIQTYVLRHGVKKLPLNGRSYMLGNREALAVLRHYRGEARVNAPRAHAADGASSKLTRLEERLASLEAKLDVAAKGVARLLEIWS